MMLLPPGIRASLDAGVDETDFAGTCQYDFEKHARRQALAFDIHFAPSSRRLFVETGKRRSFDRRHECLHQRKPGRL
jgi:hypothetical protein